MNCNVSVTYMDPGQGLTHRQKCLPELVPRIVLAFTLAFLMLSDFLFFLTSFQEKRIYLFVYFCLQPHLDIFCGFLMPYNDWFVTVDSFLPLYWDFQGKEHRHTAGASSLVPLSCKAAKETVCWSRSFWACWHGAVRHPDLQETEHSQRGGNRGYISAT